MTKKKCPPITLERISNGGYLLTYIGDNNVFYKQKYFYYTQKEAREDFWDYLKEQGITDS